MAEYQDPTIIHQVGIMLMFTFYSKCYNIHFIESTTNCLKLFLKLIDLIRSELKQQDSFWKDQLEKERKNWNSSSQGVEQAQADFELQKETFQKTLRTLKVSAATLNLLYVICKYISHKYRSFQ